MLLHPLLFLQASYLVVDVGVESVKLLGVSHVDWLPALHIGHRHGDAHNLLAILLASEVLRGSGTILKSELDGAGGTGLAEQDNIVLQSPRGFLLKGLDGDITNIGVREGDDLDVSVNTDGDLEGHSRAQQWIRNLDPSPNRSRSESYE